MSRPNISVIIPVYNCRKFLRRCLEPVVKQSLNDLEIIIINDASVDDSATILMEYARADKRISVITMEQNCGVSCARNTGIELASGDYLIFLDADDSWLETTMLEELLETAVTTSADIVNFGVRVIDQAGEVLHTSNNPHRLVDLMRSNDWHFNYCPVRNLISGKLIRENHIRFDPELVMGEDALFNVTLMCHANRLMFSEQIYYNYVMNPDSANNAGWNSHKINCTVLWFKRALSIVRNSPAYARRPDLLQELIDERLGMLTRKLAAMALVILSREELQEYFTMWSRCLDHIDYSFFNNKVFPQGWPPMHWQTVEFIRTGNLDGLETLYATQVVQCRAVLKTC